MAKYEVIAKGIFVKENGKSRELEIGEIIEDVGTHWGAKLRKINNKSFEVASPSEEDKPPKKKKE